MKEWHKEIDSRKINLSKIYPDGELPDDINAFIKDIWTRAFECGKESWRLTRSDFRDFAKNFAEIKDDIERELHYFKCDIERYVDKMEAKNEQDEN